MRKKKLAEHRFYRIGDLVQPLLEHLCGSEYVQLTGVVIKVEGPMRPQADIASLNLSYLVDRTKRVYRYEVACICPKDCRPIAIFRRAYAPELIPVQTWKKEVFLKAYENLYREREVLNHVRRLLNQQ